MGSYSRAKYVTQSTDFPRSADSKSVSASYATFADLPASSTTIGNTAFVVATNKLYIWSGVGWYLVAEVTNASPSAISGVDGSYSLAIDGTATTITAVSTDPEGFALTWSYAVTSGSLAVTPAASAIAVVNNGSGAYTLSGGATGDNSNVDIVVGQTVNFTVNASGHPFYIRDSNGGANVSSPAATGQGATSGVVSWTPNTAGTYYYQCGNHAAMVGTITVGAATVSATVAQADNVFTITPSTNTANAGTFSLTFSVTDGLNGVVSAVSAFTLVFSVTNSRYTALSVKATGTGSNQTFDDASTSNHTITANGNVTASTFSPYRHGGYATYFEGTTGNRLTIPHHADFDFSGDYVIEFWFNLEPTSNNQLMFDKSIGANNNFQIYTLSSNDKIGAFIDDSSSNTIVSYSNVGPVLVGTGWHHFSLVRDNSAGTYVSYIDGVVVNTTTSAYNCTSTKEINIGAQHATHVNVTKGHISDVKFLTTIPSDRNAAFTPPTSPSVADSNTKFLLGDLPYFKDQSASNHTITVGGDASLKPFSLFDNALYSEASHGASVSLNAALDYLSAPVSSDFAYGTGDFTIEFWSYQTTRGYNDYTVVIDLGYNGSISIWTNVTGQYLYYTGTTVRATSSATNLNTWYHVALVRSSGAVKFYINGILDGTGTDTTNVTNTSFKIASNYSASNYAYKGYISDVRSVKGTAVYTSAFTPPTAPLTAITNTTLLLNPETSISDLSQIGDIKLFGNAATSTTQVKFAGTKSIHFANSGDYLQITNSESWISGYAGNYTIEFWWYPTNIALGTYQEPLTCGTGFQLYTQSNGQVALAIDEANAGSFFWHPQNIYQLVDNTWTHFAIVKNGTAYTIYIDGVSKATTTSTNTIGTSTAVLELGSYAGGTYPSPGYYQDFRITKGLARYTANFTPPTELQG